MNKHLDFTIAPAFQRPVRNIKVGIALLAGHNPDKFFASSCNPGAI
jgi:hypothetical protein